MAKMNTVVLGQIPDCFRDGISATGATVTEVKRLLREEYKQQSNLYGRGVGVPQANASWKELVEYYGAWARAVPVGVVGPDEFSQLG